MFVIQCRLFSGRLKGKSLSIVGDFAGHFTIASPFLPHLSLIFLRYPIYILFVPFKPPLDPRHIPIQLYYRIGRIEFTPNRYIKCFKKERERKKNTHKQQTCYRLISVQKYPLASANKWTVELTERILWFDFRFTCTHPHSILTLNGWLVGWLVGNVHPRFLRNFTTENARQLFNMALANVQLSYIYGKWLR